MLSKSAKIFLYTIFIIMTCAITAVGIFDFVTKNEALPAFSQTVSSVDEKEIDASIEGFMKLLRKEKSKGDEILLCPGGETFGVKMLTDGVVVAGTTEIVCNGRKYSPAYEAGIRAGDVIVKINGKAAKSVADVTNAIEGCEGKSLLFTCRRNGKEQCFEVHSAYCEESGRYKLGVWIRDNTAGIGTVTYTDLTTGEFGGLGHGIYDADTGELLPLSRGIVTDVAVTGIIRGEQGKPGEIRGYLKNEKRGALIKNNDCGVFGIFAPIPSAENKEAIPIAKKSEVKEGKAKIRCTLDECGVCEYEVEILNVKYDAEGTKCFCVRVTDERLLEKTGGIIQGMSGSPIIQNGKLVGAVTHVMINDPKSGYGIFIENMLNAAQIPMAKAS